MELRATLSSSDTASKQHQGLFVVQVRQVILTKTTSEVVVLCERAWPAPVPLVSTEHSGASAGKPYLEANLLRRLGHSRTSSISAV
jgi:hypothetical protein